jgi:CYTH domain-containing protein
VLVAAAVSLQSMAVSLKYAVVERERRFLVAKLPGAADKRLRIVDRYVTGTRLRLREVVTEDGVVTRKLGHKVRLGEGPREIACTSLYLDDDEWDVLCRLPAKTLSKVRHLVTRGGVTVAIDELEDGTLLAEIDDQDRAPVPVPNWLDVLRDVTDDEKWTGAQLAR